MTVVNPPTAGHLAAAEIVRGDVSGGTNTSHTIVFEALAALLDAVPADAPHGAYAEAAIEGNVVGKNTEGARRRTAPRSRTWRNRRTGPDAGSADEPETSRSPPPRKKTTPRPRPWPHSR